MTKTYRATTSFYFGATAVQPGDTIIAHPAQVKYLMHALVEETSPPAPGPAVDEPVEAMVFTAEDVAEPLGVSVEEQAPRRRRRSGGDDNGA